MRRFTSLVIIRRHKLQLFLKQWRKEFDKRVVRMMKEASESAADVDLTALESMSSGALERSATAVHSARGRMGGGRTIVVPTGAKRR